MRHSVHCDIININVDRFSEYIERVISTFYCIIRNSSY